MATCQEYLAVGARSEDRLRRHSLGAGQLDRILATASKGCSAMSMRIQRQVELAIDRGGVIHRRDFLRGLSAAAMAAGALSWRDVVGLEADELRRQGKACILLWMQGGPASSKPSAPSRAIPTAARPKPSRPRAAESKSSENFPRLAKQAKHLAIIRSMTSKEGSHPACHLPAPYRLSAHGQRQISGVRFDRGQGIGAGRLRFALVRPHRQRAERQQRRACSARTSIRS